jgi:hypothetical protein
MTLYEKIGGTQELARKALDDAHLEEEEARRAFDRSMVARARILAAQSEGRSPEYSDVLLIEAYYRQSAAAAAKGLQFVELAKQGDALRQATPKSPPARRAKKESIEVMKAALRILTALTEKTPLSGPDLDELLGFAPDLTNLPPDELACEVIQRAMKRQVHLQRAINGPAVT